MTIKCNYFAVEVTFCHIFHIIIINVNVSPIPYQSYFHIDGSLSINQNHHQSPQYSILFTINMAFFVP